MRGDKIIANYEQARRSANGNCVCVNRETKAPYILESIRESIDDDGVQFKFAKAGEKYAGPDTIICDETNVEETFMLQGDWDALQMMIKTKAFPYFITNLTDEYAKEKATKGERFDRPITYFKFIQYMPDCTFIYQCDYRNGDEKDCFMIHLNIDELYDVIDDPEKVATRFYKNKKEFLNW